MIPHSHIPTETVESLRELKRRIYLWAMLAGLSSMLFSWIPKILTRKITSYESVIFPLIMVLFLGLMIALWRTLRALVWVEWSLFAITTISLLGTLQETMQSPVTARDPHHLVAFVDILYWFPLVYVLAFLIFNSRRQLLFGSVVFFAVSVVLGMVHTIPELLRGESTEFYLLLRFYLANVAYIILLMVGVRLNEQYIRVYTMAETMAHLANTDALMQISNRRELEATIDREINRATRHNQPLSAVLFDLDHFKHVNDNYGHQVGDSVLQETARLVQTTLRITDFLGRWGGEEFLVIAPQTDCIQAQGLAERLRNAIAMHPHQHAGKVTASFGVAQYELGTSPDAWLKCADDALYAAKQSGRNRVATE
ncbi:MAG: GGDEF domain-containing protein [Anaerolineales bacterium]|nr:GGDEF domain-containing protein [Anaerolineales bacterium]